MFELQLGRKLTSKFFLSIPTLPSISSVNGSENYKLTSTNYKSASEVLGTFYSISSSYLPFYYAIAGSRVSSTLPSILQIISPTPVGLSETFSYTSQPPMALILPSQEQKKKKHTTAIWMQEKWGKRGKPLLF